MKISQTAIKKIAVFRALQLGDMLCSIPALRALHQAYPNASITLLGLPWAESLKNRFPDYIHSFIHFPGYPGLPEQEFDPADFVKFLLQVQREKFDLVFQMQGNGSIVNPMVELFAGKYTAGFCMPGDYCPGPEFFLTYPEGIHEAERHLRLMAHLGIPAQGAELEFPLYKKDYDEYAEAGISVEAGNYVCIHPGSRGSWRQWPPEHFAALGNFCARQDLKVVLTGTADELGIIRQVSNHLDQEPLIAAAKTSLGAVAVLIKNARLLIANCTGVSHIASALETPSLIISMDGEPERWGPQNKALHRTIDWTKNPNFDSALTALAKLLDTPLQRDHSGNSFSPEPEHLSRSN